MLDFINKYILLFGIGDEATSIVTRGVAIFCVLLLSLISDVVARRFIVRGVIYLVGRSQTNLDDIFIEHKVFTRLSHLAPAIVFYGMMPLALEGYGSVAAVVKSASLVYMIAIILFSVDSFLNAIIDIYRNFEVSKDIPIKGFIQVVKIVVYFLGIVIIIAVVLNKTPLYILSGMGALTAVLMLIFKDAILGFVAGIQLISNKMIAHGDWVEIPKFGADGDVVEVSLTTVKIRNFDNTITTVPTYALISGSFKNWRGMADSDGRRIKRSIYIDMNSIKFCTDEMVERFSAIEYISDYITAKSNDIASYNKNTGVDTSNTANGRRLTNVGTFRAYMLSYLRNHPMINKNLTLLVRQLQPTENGLPIEVYIFSKDKRWVNYEEIQSDIFDHFIAVAGEFDLRLFQNPTGLDFKGALS